MFAIMPVNIPILTKMNVSHFFQANMHHFSLYDRVLKVVFYLAERHEVEEVAAVGRIVDSILQVGAGLASSCERRVL